MNIKTILQEFIPTKEIKARIASKQIKVNLVVVLDMNEEVEVQDGWWELGNFIYFNITPNSSFPPVEIVGNIRNFFGKEETNIPSLQFLTGYTLITISKREEYVFINQ